MKRIANEARTYILMCGYYRNINPTEYSVGFPSIHEFCRQKLTGRYYNKTLKPRRFARRSKQKSDVMTTKINML